MQKLLSDTL